MKKSWLKAFGIVVLVLVAVVAAFVMLLQTPQATHFAFGKLQEYLRDDYGIQLQASGVRVDTARGSVTMHGVVLRSTSAPDLPPIVEAERVSFDFGVLKILKGLFDIQNARVDAPKIHYVQTRDGRDNLPKPAQSSESSRFLIGHGEVVDGSLLVQDDQHTVRVLLPQWHVQITGSALTLSHNIVFQAQQAGSFSSGDEKIPIDAIDLNAEYQQLPQTALSVRTGHLTSGGSSLALIGAVQNLSAPVLHFSLRPNLNLAEISRIAGTGSKILGQLTGEIVVQGPTDKLTMDANVRGTQVAADRFAPVDFHSSAEAEWDRSAASVHMPRFALDSPLGSIEGSADFATGGGASSIEAHVIGVDLQTISERFGGLVQIASRASGTVAIQWHGRFDPATVSGKADLNLARIRSAPTKDRISLAGSLDAVLRDNRILVNVRSANALGTTIRGTLSLAGMENLEGGIEGEIPDVDVAMAETSKFLGRHDRSLIGMRVSGPVKFSAKASGKIKQPRLTAKADAPSLSVGTLKGVGIHVTAEMSNNRVVFKNSAVLPENQIVQTEGNVVLGGKAPVVNIDARADRLSIPAVLAMLDRNIQSAPPLGVACGSQSVGYQ